MDVHLIHGVHDIVRTVRKLISLQYKLSMS